MRHFRFVVWTFRPKEYRPFQLGPINWIDEFNGPRFHNRKAGYIGRGIYWSRDILVTSPSVRQEPSIPGILNFINGFLMEKYLTHVYFFPSHFPYWSYAPLNNIWIKSDACHILWTVHARVLKLHTWIPHRKIANLYVFLAQAISLSGIMSLSKIQNGIFSARYLNKSFACSASYARGK